MLSIITKDTATGTKCSINGTPTLHETIAALECVARVLRICTPNADAETLGALIAKAARAGLLNDMEGLSYE